MYSFLTQSYEMNPLSDYQQHTFGFNPITNMGINATRRKICYDQPIIDDMRLEVSEYFGLTLVIQGMPFTTVLTEIRPMYDQVAIKILDDDSKQLQ